MYIVYKSEYEGTAPMSCDKINDKLTNRIGDNTFFVNRKEAKKYKYVIKLCTGVYYNIKVIAYVDNINDFLVHLCKTDGYKINTFKWKQGYNICENNNLSFSWEQNILYTGG